MHLVRHRKEIFLPMESITHVYSPNLLEHFWHFRSALASFSTASARRARTRNSRKQGIMYQGRHQQVDNGKIKHFCLHSVRHRILLEYTCTASARGCLVAGSWWDLGNSALREHADTRAILKRRFNSLTSACIGVEEKVQGEEEGVWRPEIRVFRLTRT